MVSQSSKMVVDRRPRGYRECPTLQADVARFLASGGQIEHCPACTYADDARRYSVVRENRQTWERRQQELSD